MFKSIFARIMEILQENGYSDGKSAVMAVLILILVNVICLLLMILFWNLMQKTNKFFFRRIERKRGKSLYIDFMQRVVSFLISVVCVVMVLGWDNLRQSLLGSATVLAAIVGFAGQDIIKDTLAGLQISIYRPFDVGDRIEMEDGTAGIVDSMTMRHVVISKIDTVKIVIPNSRLNIQTIHNYSYRDVPRSVLLKYPISYGSNVMKAKKIIQEVIRELPCCVPGKDPGTGRKEYAPVYFLNVEDSALIMAVTVYYDHKTPTEQVLDKVNSAVFRALTANGIEIPYPHMNVIMNTEGK